MLDIQAFTQALYAIPSVTFGQARAFVPVLNMYSQEMQAGSSLNGVLNWITGTGQDKTTIQNLQQQLLGFSSYINDTSAHADSDDYDRWPAFRDFWIKLYIEADAVGVAVDTSIANVEQVPTDIGQGLADLPGRVALDLTPLLFVGGLIVLLLVLGKNEI